MEAPARRPGHLGFAGRARGRHARSNLPRSRGPKTPRQGAADVSETLSASLQAKSGCDSGGIKRSYKPVADTSQQSAV